MIGLWFVVGGVLMSTPEGGAYLASARTQEIEHSLSALSETPLERLEDARRYIDVMARNACTSTSYRLQSSCLTQAARRNCRSERRRSRRERCLRFMDVLVTNKLSERAFISENEKYELMKTYQDYRGALRQELRQRYGALAAGLSLASTCAGDDPGCVAQAIDAYCLGRAESESLAWHHCTAALTWFVGYASHPAQS